MSTDDGQPAGADPLARFRSWRGFLLAAIVLNALFAWGMWGSASDPGTRAWTKALSWFPFNVIATALYLVFMAKLARADGAGPAHTGGAFYVILCVAMIAANWILMFAA